MARIYTVRSHSEIKLELSKLERLLKFVPSLTPIPTLFITDTPVQAAALQKMFVERNKECIRAQIRVLRKRMTYRDIEDTFDGIHINMLCSALDAADWLYGNDWLFEKYPESDIKPGEPPSDSWIGFLTEAA